VNPQKYVIYGTFVIEQDSIINIEEKDPETYKNPNIKRPIIDDIFTPTTHGQDYPEIVTTQKPNIKKIFKFTEYHKQNLNNVYINLTYQTECMGFPQSQCWSSKLEFENETIDNFHVEVAGLFTPNCKIMLNTECTRKQGINCFRMECSNKWLYVHSNSTDEKDWLLPRKSIFFLLKKGNYHSSWQASTLLNPSLLKNNKLVQDVMKKFNYYEHFPENQLLLTFTNVYEFPNKKFFNDKNDLWYNTTDYRAVWKDVKLLYINKIKNYICIHCKIEARPNVDTSDLLHERVHEYITSKFLGKRIINYRNLELYVGDKTVKLVAQDSKINKKLSKSIFLMRESGRYGLIMQDSNHLGNWGVESSASNYDNVFFNIGKYTMSIINELGYYMT